MRLHARALAYVLLTGAIRDNLAATPVDGRSDLTPSTSSAEDIEAERLALEHDPEWIVFENCRLALRHAADPSGDYEATVAFSRFASFEEVASRAEETHLTVRGYEFQDGETGGGYRIPEGMDIAEAAADSRRQSNAAKEVQASMMRDAMTTGPTLGMREAAEEAFAFRDREPTVDFVGLNSREHFTECDPD